jgi:soluble lytic murein transglycosylase-like protein
MSYSPVKIKPDNPYITKAAHRHGVERDWLVALLLVESNLTVDPKPRWEPHISEHSYGVGQVLPSTAMWMVRSPLDFPIEPAIRAKLQHAAKLCGWKGEKAVNALYQTAEVGVELAGAYLGYQYKRYGNIDDAVAAYNAGSVKKDDEGNYINAGYVVKWHSALHSLKEM